MAISDCRARRRRAGFTLVELLVVIVIIAILASVLAPVFAAAREVARQISCMSNMRQLAMAVHMYIQDFDENFPAQAYSDVGYYNDPSGSVYNGCVRGGGGADVISWASGLHPYLDNRKILVCPSSQAIPCSVCPIPPTTESRITYYYNGMVSVGAAGEPQPVGSLTGVPRPSDLAVFWEMGDYVTSDSALSPRWMPEYGWVVWSWGARAPHDGGSNVAFADGHSKTLRPYDLSYGCSASGVMQVDNQIGAFESIFNPYKQ